MFTVKADFMGGFKIGDNINYNLETLRLLYDFSSQSNPYQQKLLLKPTTIILVSIIEAILHDFHLKVRFNQIEGVADLASSVMSYIRSRRIDDLEKYIASARKHNFFDMQTLDFYNYLDQLRILRNRIHIQNIKYDFEPDEIDAFTESRKIIAEKVLEKVIKVMIEKYPRAEHARGYVSDFKLPWEEHFSA